MNDRARCSTPVESRQRASQLRGPRPASQLAAGRAGVPHRERCTHCIPADRGRQVRHRPRRWRHRSDAGGRPWASRRPLDPPGSPCRPYRRQAVRLRRRGRSGHPRPPGSRRPDRRAVAAPGPAQAARPLAGRALRTRDRSEPLSAVAQSRKRTRLPSARSSIGSAACSVQLFDGHATVDASGRPIAWRAAFRRDRVGLPLVECASHRPDSLRQVGVFRQTPERVEFRHWDVGLQRPSSSPHSPPGNSPQAGPAPGGTLQRADMLTVRAVP